LHLIGNPLINLTSPKSPYTTHFERADLPFRGESIQCSISEHQIRGALQAFIAPSPCSFIYTNDWEFLQIFAKYVLDRNVVKAH